VPPAITPKSLEGKSANEIEQTFCELADNIYGQREQQMGAEKMRLLEKLVMIQIIDRLWVEHLTAMENMRLQAGWQALRQVRSVDAYKSTGYQQFQTLLETIRHDVAATIFHVSISEKGQSKAPQSPMAKAGVGSRGDSKPAAGGSNKPGRNDPCPCGSGKKYKHCCGK
jgi:preprotein translocase subunit SecA